MPQLPHPAPLTHPPTPSVSHFRTHTPLLFPRTASPPPRPDDAPPTLSSRPARTACGDLPQFRNLLNHFVFGTEVKRVVQANVAKPLVLPAGSDTLEGIGLPPGCTRSDVEAGSVQSRVGKYKRPCDDMFPAYGAGASV
jgi:hypothetical protein